MTMISNFLFNFTNFCLIVSFLTKFWTLGILFSTAVRTVAVTKFAILDILFLTSFILTLRAVVVVSNTKCFSFNLIYFSIKNSFSS